MTVLAQSEASTKSSPSSQLVSPRWATRRRPDRRSFGPAVAEVAAKLGRPLMPWQRFVADVALEVTESGEWAYRRVVLVLPRRAGKTVLMQPVMAHRCAQPGQLRKVWMTAQTRDKARARFFDVARPLKSQLERDSRRRGAKPQIKLLEGNGTEELRWLSTGSFLKPFVPNDEAMHGEESALVAVDEAWRISLEEARGLTQAYRPTMAGQNAQEWVLSARGDERSTWLDELVEQGRQDVAAGVDSGTAYFEWSVPEEVAGVPIRELEDQQLIDVVAVNHPSFGVVLDRPWLVDELKALGRNEFLRGYGNLPAPGGARAQGISATAWADAGLDREPAGLMGLGVHVDDDGMVASVIAAGAGAVEVIVPTDENGDAVDTEGTGWIIPFVRDVVANNDVGSIAFRSTGPGRDVADSMLQDGDLAELVLLLAGPDYAASCQRFKAGISSLRWAHRSQPSLDESVRTSSTRKSGNGWVWEATPPLHAAGLAVWAHDHPSEQLGTFKIL